MRLSRTALVIATLALCGLKVASADVFPPTSSEPVRFPYKGNVLLDPHLVKFGNASPSQPWPKWFRPNKDRPLFRGTKGNQKAHYTADLADLGSADSYNLTSQWLGLDQESYPPDCDFAVGSLNSVVLSHNSQFAVYDKAGDLQAGPYSFGTVVGSATTYTGNFFDPRVEFDPWERRWVALILRKNETVTDKATVHLLVSENENPTGNWYVRTYDSSTGTNNDLAWSDFYDLGIGRNSVYMSGNQFRWSNGNYSGSQVIIIDKEELYSGVTVPTRQTVFPLPSPIGMTAFAPQCASMLSDPPDADMYLVNSNNNGGSAVLLHKVQGSAGGATVVNFRVNISNYDSVPDILQPDGRTLDNIIDCRIRGVSYAEDVDSGDNHLWLTFTEGISQPSNRSFLRVCNINPQAASLRWEESYGAEGWFYFYPAIEANYRGEALISFGRSGPASGRFPEHRLTTVEDDGSGGFFISTSTEIFKGPTVALNNGTAPNTRWGDYFDACLDWGDYVYGLPAGTAGRHKIWAYGMVTTSSGDHVTDVGSAVIDASSGILEVGQASPSVLYTVVGSSGPDSITIRIENTGDVGLNWDARTTLVDLEAIINARGELSAGESETVTYQPKSSYYNTGYERREMTVGIKRAGSSTSQSRTITLSRGMHATPDLFNLVLGEPFNDDLNNLAVSDDQYFSLFNDSVSSSAAVHFFGTKPTGGISRLRAIFEGRVERAGLVESVYRRNYNTGTWSFIHGASSKRQDQVYEILDTEDTATYFGNGRMGLMMFWTPVNDEEPAQDGWLHRIDQIRWTLYP